MPALFPYLLYHGLSSTRVFSSTHAPPKTQIAPFLVTPFFNIPWLTLFWIIWKEVGVAHNYMWKCKVLIQILSCLFSPATVWSNDMSQKCEIHILNSFHSLMNLKIYSNFDLNHPVAYFPFCNLYTFCMHRLTRKQPIKRLVLGHVISRSFLPEQSLTFCNISHDWKEDKFPYTMIYRSTLISFNYHGYTGIYDRMHGLKREVDTATYEGYFNIM